MKLPLILQLLVQPHILFCSVVVGSGHCFGATSNVTGATGLLQRCQRPRPRRETMTTLFTAFYEKNLASRRTIMSSYLWRVRKITAFNTCKRPNMTRRTAEAKRPDKCSREKTLISGLKFVHSEQANTTFERIKYMNETSRQY